MNSFYLFGCLAAFFITVFFIPYPTIWTFVGLGISAFFYAAWEMDNIEP